MPRRGRRVRLAKGIYRDGSGIAVIFQVGGEKPEEHRFPASSELDKLKDWRADQIRKQRDRLKRGHAPAGTFAADAETYLAAVTALPRYAQRVVDIGYWVALFGDRRRSSIEPHEIRAVRDRWLTVGPKMIQTRAAAGLPARWTPIAAPLAPQTVALRMRALENLWTVLDGKKADNPVREVPEPEEASATPRGLSYRVIERILRRMPAEHPMTWRLHVMAYAGLAQSELARVTAADLNLRRRMLWVPGRKKGRGAKGGMVPLSQAAVTALKRLVDLEALGPFNVSSLWHFFQDHARAAGYHGLRPYDLRHSFFTGVQLASGDERAVAAISRHASVITLRRYTEAAAHPRAVAAVARFRDGRSVPRSVPGFAIGTAQNRAAQRGTARRKTQ